MESSNFSHLKQTHLFFAFRGFFGLAFLGKDADPAEKSVVYRSMIDEAKCRLFYQE